MTDVMETRLASTELRAARWLAYAQTDLHRADSTAEDDPEIAVFHFQQAAEKALKALLVAAGSPFERTHSLDRLLVRAAQIDVGILQCPGNPEEVSGYVSRFRYPDEMGDDLASPEEVAGARLVAEWLLNAVEQRLSGPVAEVAAQMRADRAARRT